MDNELVFQIKNLKNLLSFQEDLVGQPHQMGQEDPKKCEKYLLSNWVLFYGSQHCSNSGLKPTCFLHFSTSIFPGKS